MSEEEAVFGRNEAEIEQIAHEKLQEVAKQAIKAALEWTHDWEKGRASIKRKVYNHLDARLENAVFSDAITTKARQQANALAEKLIAENLTEDYVRNHPSFEAAMQQAEQEFWNGFSYRLRECARRIGEQLARQNEANFERSTTNLIRTTILDHFAASDGLAELAEEANRK